MSYDYEAEVARSMERYGHVRDAIGDGYGLLLSSELEDGRARIDYHLTDYRSIVPLGTESDGACELVARLPWAKRELAEIGGGI